jgi:hypothetical protein
MPKKIYCNSDFCIGREYEGLGFNNNKVHAEHIHNDGYVTSPPMGVDRSYHLESGTVWPGTIKRPIRGFE